MKIAERTAERPRLALTLLFVLWKAFILLAAIASPGVGYDTSGDLLATDGSSSSISNDVPLSSGDRLFHLVRWDAIYYGQTAQRGLIFEQEWAFGIGLPKIVSFLKEYILFGSADGGVQPYIYTAIILSHFAHWIATSALFSLAELYVEHRGGTRGQTPFIAAALYIVSPAGVFLSAPYAESTFACLNMVGFYLYAKAISTAQENQLLSSVLRLLSGISLGIATVVRSNGILGGIIFLLDALAYTVKILDPATPAPQKPRMLLDLQFTIMAGLCIAIGMFLPQYQGYQEYCGTSQARAWCRSTIPSIFTFVQSHYWDVGFLRYWTVSNSPLFLLAAPQLYILIRSGLEGCTIFFAPSIASSQTHHLAGRLAMPQLVLAVLALFSYHVQIISRLSSGYPFWYIWLALGLGETSSQRFARFFVIYGVIQAGLYAAFLPPA